MIKKCIIFILLINCILYGDEVVACCRKPICSLDFNDKVRVFKQVGIAHCLGLPTTKEAIEKNKKIHGGAVFCMGERPFSRHGENFLFKKWDLWLAYQELIEFLDDRWGYLMDYYDKKYDEKGDEMFRLSSCLDIIYWSEEYDKKAREILQKYLKDE